MPVPKFGRLTNPAEDILKEIKITSDLGFDFVEIGIEGPGGDPDLLIRKKRQILKALQDNGLFAIGHTSWWFELGSTYDGVRKGWIAEGKGAIGVASELGMGMINFHSHSRGMGIEVPRTKKRILENFVLSMGELVDFGKSLGIKVVIENGVENREIVSPQDIRYITDKVKGLGFHLDVGHAYVTGGMEGVRDFIRTFRTKLWHVHMHDNHGQGDEHLPLGVGTLEYEKVVSALKRIGYSRTVTLEVFARDRDYAQYSMNKLKRLWREK